ncbi:MAG: DNA-binding response regulator [Acidimicrobiales bacterium]|nr:MAG: DNA-binding response regulator [Acidimicrobiales bacterium]
MIRVVIVDDESIVVESLAMILSCEEDLEVVGTAGDGAEALECVERVGPDVVVMDLKMPGMDGITATRHLVAGGRDHPTVLALTTLATEDLALDAIRAGAAGFCAKADPPGALAQAIRAVAKGDAVVSPIVLGALLNRLVRPTGPSPAEAGPAEVGRGACTARERDVLVALSRGETNGQVAAGLFISEATVRTHIGHLRTKLGARNRAELVVRAWERGLNRPTAGSAGAGSLEPP